LSIGQVAHKKLNSQGVVCRMIIPGLCSPTILRGL